MLTIAELGVSYGGLRALVDLSLEVAEGEFVTIVGPNGAGKTTLLKAISGTAAATGRIVYRGRDIGALRASERAALGIAHVPEGRRVFPSLTVGENLELGSYRRAARPGRAKALAEVLELFPILRQRRASSPARSRAASSRCWPSAAGSWPSPICCCSTSRRKAWARVSSSRSSRPSIASGGSGGSRSCWSSSVSSRRSSCADRGYVLETGRVVLAGERAALLADARVQRAYLGA